MSNTSPRRILYLYKDLLKYGKQLQLTDKDYFTKRIRNEFKKNKTLENPEEIDFQYKKGVTLLKTKRIL